MKKIFTSVLVVLGLSVYAQPVLQYANFPGAGLTGTVYTGPLPSPGPSGANVTWNYSSLTYTPVGTITTTNVAGTPFASSFPSANWAAVLTSTVFGNIYVYLNVQPTISEQIGNNITATGGSTYTPNPKTDLVFPFAYGNSLSDTYQCVGCSSGSMTRTYDAYGTMMINGKTYSNVVRVTSFFGGTSYYYNYYIANPVVSILSFDGTGSSSSYIELPPSALGVSEVSALSGLKLFPNPANGSFSIANLNSFTVSYEVKDVVGKTVKSPQTVNQLSENKIDISDLSKGIYFVSCADEKGNTSVLKLIVE